MLIIGGPYDARFLLDIRAPIGGPVIITDETGTEHVHLAETPTTCTYLHSAPAGDQPVPTAVASMTEPQSPQSPPC